MYSRTSTPDNPESARCNLRHTRGVQQRHFTQSPSPPKKRKPAKKENSKKAKLEKPLSELTAHFDHIPIKDTEAWVTRSTDQRRKAVGSDGFIKRPSNSFILYRSAYADRCREYEKSNNHQDISSMAGASWAIEPPLVRKKYEDWAKTERENHQAAFPDYKFQPQTQEAKAKKRKGKFDEDSLEESDLDDLTYMGGRGATPGSARSAKMKRSRMNHLDPSYTPSIGSDGDWGSPESYPPGMYTASYYDPPIAGKPLPTAMTRVDPQTSYYQRVAYPGARFSNLGHVEDISYHRTEPCMESYGLPAPTGLPGIHHAELMGDESADNGHITFTDTTLDPEMLALTHSAPYAGERQVRNPDGYHPDDYLQDGLVDFELDESRVDDGIKWE